MEHQHIHHNHAISTWTEWIPVELMLVTGIIYLIGFVRLRICNARFSWGQLISFQVGIGMVAVAMLPPLMHWAHQDLRGHMVIHLLIGMFAPIFLVMGAPVTMALKVLPTHLARSITAILSSRFFGLIGHPITALLLNIGGMFVLYLTPLYNASLTNPYLHHLIHFHFLAAGYLYAWSLVGPDPAPGRPNLRVRMAVLFIGMGSHAFLSKFMYAYLYPINSPHSIEQIQEGAKLMYYWGDLSEIILAVILFYLWYQKRGQRKYSLSPMVS